MMFLDVYTSRKSLEKSLELSIIRAIKKSLELSNGLDQPTFSDLPYFLTISVYSRERHYIYFQPAAGEHFSNEEGEM